MIIHEIHNELGKAVINKGLKKAAETGGSRLDCVNEVWKKVFGVSNHYKKDVFERKDVNWQKILETLI